MNIIKKIAIGAALGFGYVAAASALIVAPDAPPSVVGPTCTGSGTGTDAAFFASCDPAIDPGNFLYKQNAGVGGTESGVLAGSYTTTFNGELSGGTIVWGGGSLPFANCTTFTCWLLVKDGNQTPGRYLFNLSAAVIGLPWDGKETITLQGFWPDNGSISHVSLYGGSALCTLPNNCEPPDETPEPGTLALLGLGLMGIAASRRKKMA